MGAEGQQIVMCDEHQFVIVVRDFEMSCYGSPGRRATGCHNCDAAVADALSRTDLSGS